MKPFQLPIARGPWLVPRLVEDAFGKSGLVSPRDEDVPRHFVLQLHGFPSDAATVDVIYPARLRAEEKIFPLAFGHVVIDGTQGYLRRILAVSPPADLTHYDTIARLIAAYRAYARCLPVHDEWRWYTIFVAELVSTYWSEHARDLRMLTRVPPAP